MISLLRPKVTVQLSKPIVATTHDVCEANVEHGVGVTHGLAQVFTVRLSDMFCIRLVTWSGLNAH